MKSVKIIRDNPLKTIHKLFVEKHLKRKFMTKFTTCVWPIGHNALVFRFRNGNLDSDVSADRSLFDVLLNHIAQRVQKNEIG